jgi:CubicO group peptidase (beta-lactamase class C family)
MIFTSENLVYVLGVLEADYNVFRDEHAKKGFRTLSLSLCGPPEVPIYTGVMVKRTHPLAGKSWLRLSKAALNEKIKEMAKAGLHPYIISAAGTFSNTAYAIAFRAMDTAPLVFLDLTADEYQTCNERQRDAGRILIWLDSFGSETDVRYCGVWAPNPSRIAWNTDAVADSGTVSQQRFEAMVSVGARPALAALTPTAGEATVYVDSRLDAWVSRPPLTRAQFEEDAAAQAKNGLFPVCIGSVLYDAKFYFLPIYARSDDVIPREWRVRGTQPAGLSPADQSKRGAIDEMMKTFVSDMNLRGAALAIVQGTRLVYAMGYTLAEPAPWYPDVHPTTLFRQASVSKTFCAVAAWKLLADSQSLSRDSKMQYVLHLTTPEGGDPVDPDFSKITIRHLLESNSGVATQSLADIVKSYKAGSGAQPLTSDHMARLIAARDMPGKPGDEVAHYNNAGYFLLSRVVSAMRATTGFEEALKKVVLDPLKMTRTRGSRSLVEDQPADEARYHQTTQLRNEKGEVTASHLPTATSAMHQDRRLLPGQYGPGNHEVYDGCGGLSAAVIDVARLCAMFSCRTNTRTTASRTRRSSGPTARSRSSGTRRRSRATRSSVSWRRSGS